MVEADDEGHREELPDHPIEFDDPPRVYNPLRTFFAFRVTGDLYTRYLPPDYEEEPESDHSHHSEINDPLEDEEDGYYDSDTSSDGLSGYGGYEEVHPRRRPSPQPSGREIRSHLWAAAAQEDISDSLRAALIELADQTDSEDEDSHVRTRKDWFERGNILDDVRNPNATSEASDDEEDDGEDDCRCSTGQPNIRHFLFLRG